ncbi:hypothetical protein INR49_012243 [Caranx melampygus]|nr:hypothetical protein INR49_012243 [Caranx melampygus]
MYCLLAERMPSPSTNHWSPRKLQAIVGEAHSRRRFQIQHVGNLVPAECVLVQRGPIIVHLKIRVHGDESESL